MMIKVSIVGLLILLVSVTMTMVGKGGGNFYVVILTLANIPIHQAATTGQFILFSASISAMIIYQKKKVVVWPLALLIGAFTSLAALGGGFFSHLFSGASLKLIFASMLVVAGVIMLLPVSEKSYFDNEKKIGYWKFTLDEKTHILNLWIAVPVTILIGFCSGMVGVSGGSFLVPLMVLACGVPMHAAVGTASVLIAVTAFMGFSGHLVQGDFNPYWAVPLALITIIGGIVGGKLTFKSKPRNLKKLFAYTNWLAAVLMIVNAFLK